MIGVGGSILPFRFSHLRVRIYRGTLVWLSYIFGLLHIIFLRLDEIVHPNTSLQFILSHGSVETRIDSWSSIGNTRNISIDSTFLVLVVEGIFITLDLLARDAFLGLVLNWLTGVVDHLRGVA